MKSQDVAQIIEEFAPLSLQAEWDNSGFQVNNSPCQIKGILLCLDITEAIIEEAIDLGCNFIAAHHPLIFGGIKKIGDNTYVERCIKKAIKNDIALYAAHTNLDSVKDGISGKMCEKLDIKKTLILEDNSAETGLGMIGEFQEEISEHELLKKIKRTFNVNCLKTSKLLNKKVKRIAVCGGSGASLIEQAITLKADAYITADIKYHDYTKAENKLLIIDTGHFESEQCAKEIFFELLSKKITTFAIRSSKVEQNPIHSF